MDNAETVAHNTSESLSSKGYIFWKCATLGDTICIIPARKNRSYKNHAIEICEHKVKQGKFTELPVIYTVDEVRILCESSTILLVHQGKKFDRDSELTETE